MTSPPKAKILKRTLFGNPILRAPARRLSVQEISSDRIRTLVADMRYSLAHRQYGVGLAAPQVGQGIALSVIAIKPTPTRPDSPHIDLVIINPEILTTYGAPIPKWEGCLSFGSGPAQPYAQATRYETIRVRYYDEHGAPHEQDYDGLLSHVLQHEIDHLNGILFVDRVIDPKSFITISEYRRRYLRKALQTDASAD